MIPMIRPAFCLALALSGASAAPLLAQCAFTNVPGTLLSGGDNYGKSVAIVNALNSHVAAIGVPGDEQGVINAGSVRISTFAGGVWSETARITAPTPETSAAFGTSVSLQYPFLLVGAPGEADGGGAYVFEHSGNQWVHRATIEPFSTDPGDHVGQSVAMDNDWGIIGCSHADETDGQGNPHTDCGLIHFIRRNQNGAWVSAATYVFAQDYSYSGWSVSLRGDRAAAGRPWAQAVGGPPGAGAVAVFRWNGQQVQFVHTLSDPSWGEYDNVGYSVAISGSYLVAGAPGDDADASELPPGSTAKTNCGSVLIFKWNDSIGRYEYVTRVFASDASDNARFGSTVALDGSLLVVGAEGARQAYVFRARPASQGGGWHEIARYAEPVQGGIAHNFASAVATRDSRIIVGDPGRDGAGQNSGAAVIITAPSAAAPADPCASATPIGVGSYTGCTTLATSDGFTACGNGGLGQGPDTWFSFTPECSGPVTIDTATPGSGGLDTVLSVHTDCPTIDNYHLVVCNDNAPGLGSASRVTFNAVGGTRYLIRVAGVSQTRGDFTLNLSMSSAAPSNDLCNAATFVTLGTTHFRNCGAGILGGLESLCGPAGPNMISDVWFRYIPAETGVLTIDTCGSGFDTVLAAYASSTCPSGSHNAVACSDDDDACGPGSTASRISFPVSAGQNLFIRVAGNSTLSAAAGLGDGVLHLALDTTPACPCDVTGDDSLSVQDIFDFLALWFTASPAADFNQTGDVTVQDIFDFLACWFSGC